MSFSVTIGEWKSQSIYPLASVPITYKINQQLQRDYTSTTPMTPLPLKILHISSRRTPTWWEHKFDTLLTSPLQGGGPRKGPRETKPTKPPIPPLSSVDRNSLTRPKEIPEQHTPHTITSFYWWGYSYPKASPQFSKPSVPFPNCPKGTRPLKDRHNYPYPKQWYPCPPHRYRQHCHT